MELTKKIKEGKIKVPHYQRGQVWKESQKDKLIDSIKKGYPFGAILLYKKTENTFQLIDGLQRISTLYEYLYHPAKFFKETDISDQTINDIYDLLNIGTGQEKVIKSNILIQIGDWVTKNHQTMEDIKNINAVDCATFLETLFPSCTSESALKIAKILTNEFNTFKMECEELTNIDIPAIVYEGNPDNLPEVFNRINSNGITLSKYQILSATWTTHEYKLISTELNPIIEYVDRFYTSIISEHFNVDGYDVSTIHETRQLNLYQIIFGFSKLLSNRYPYLFISSKNNKEVESCGFNLINSCLGNKNNSLAKLPSVLTDVFDNNDKEFNNFLINILHTTDNVYKLLKPYLEFKLNKRSSTKEVYHTEFQICSMIANYFIARYCTYAFDDEKHRIIERKITFDKSNKYFETYKKSFKNNAFKRYLIDMMNDNWRGSGDRRMDDVTLNRNYYTDEISEIMFTEELDHWINQINSNRHEVKKVSNPNAIEKILLSVIYSHSFSAYEQNDDINYDIEHLAPKGCLKILLKKIPNYEDGVYGLPISSFANLCLLREGINRKKKDKTLYHDSIYLHTLEEKNILLEEIENKFSFTRYDDLKWIEEEYLDFDRLKHNYVSFLNKRFDKQKEIIIHNLFSYNSQNAIHYSIKNVMHSPISVKVDQLSISNVKNSVLKEDKKEYVLNYSDIIKNLDGWKKDIFNLVNDFNSNTFILEDLYQFEDKLSELHPSNNSIRAEIRQSLQQLRDLELVKFEEERGKYKRLWK